MSEENTTQVDFSKGLVLGHLPKRHKVTRWCIPVLRVLDGTLEKPVKLKIHSTKSDFNRDAVRRRLEDMGYNRELLKEFSAT